MLKASGVFERYRIHFFEHALPWCSTDKNVDDPDLFRCGSYLLNLSMTERSDIPCTSGGCSWGYDIVYGIGTEGCEKEDK